MALLHNVNNCGQGAAIAVRWVMETGDFRMHKLLRRIVISAWISATLLALSGCGGGGDSSSKSTAAVIHATAMAVAGAANATLTTPLGGTLTLDGSSSTVSSGTPSYAWSISVRPAGSVASLQHADAAVATFEPDVAGRYEFTLRVSSGRSSAVAVLPVTVTEAVPVVRIDSAVSLTGPSVSHPAQAVSLGSVVALDASGSRDAAGEALTLAFTFLSKPQGSAVVLDTTATTARFRPDVAGSYQVRVRGSSSTGNYADAVHTFDVTASAPTVAVATSLSTVGSSSALAAAVGNLVALDGGASTVPSGNGRGSWAVIDKPAASTLTQLASSSATAVSFVPDVAGSYVLQYSLVDQASGAASFHQVRVEVVVGPTAVVSASSAPVAQVGGPSYVGAVGAPITLRGSGSYDPNGDTLTYAWVLDTRPLGSLAALTGAGTATPSFTPDVDGRYGATLTVTNSAGLRAVQSLSVYVGSFPPVVILDATSLLALQGQTVTASAAASYSQGGGTLRYSWSLDTRPAGSAATLAVTNTAQLNFTPDVAGTYYASLTVTDGGVSTVSGVTVTALSASGGTVPLTYKPLLTRYSRSQNLAVIVSANPNRLHLVNPSTATDTAVALPAAAKALSLSADGLLAGVLHEGSVSLVDLATAQVLSTTATGGAQTEVFTSNAGMLFVTGQTGGQWVSPAFVAINGRTGSTLSNGSSMNIYGVTRGVMSESLGRLYTLSEGLSPSQIYWTGVTPGSGAFTGSNGGSPYWGDYGMSNPLWLSSDDSLLFTSAGTYFKASDLTYAGTLGAKMISVSHSGSAAEALGLVSDAMYLNGSPTHYPSLLKRFTGSLLQPAADVALPLFNGQPTYGLAVFHSADDKRVMLVQTGSDQPNAGNLSYLLLLLR